MFDHCRLGLENILANNQYDFRKNHSTAYALIQLYDKLSDAIDQGKITLGPFIDQSKACDTVNNDILFAKLEFYRGSWCCIIVVQKLSFL